MDNSSGVRGMPHHHTHPPNVKIDVVMKMIDTSLVMVLRNLDLKSFIEFFILLSIRSVAGKAATSEFWRLLILAEIVMNS